jgi:hypothetical protein
MLVVAPAPPSPSHPGLAGRAAKELAHAVAFSAAVAGVVVVVNVACWAAGISVVTVQLPTSLTSVALTAALPSFFAAWLFFLARRFAWSSARRAAACAGAAATVGVVAFERVLGSGFYEVVDDVRDPAALWCDAVTHGCVSYGSVGVDVAVVAGVAVAAALVQRVMAKVD